MKIWDPKNEKWIYVLDNTGNRDIWDEDGYCSCSMCRDQKELEEEIKQEKKNLVPDELFEL